MPVHIGKAHKPLRLHGEPRSMLQPQVPALRPFDLEGPNDGKKEPGVAEFLSECADGVQLQIDQREVTERSSNIGPSEFLRHSECEGPRWVDLMPYALQRMGREATRKLNAQRK